MAPSSSSLGVLCTIRRTCAACVHWRAAPRKTQPVAPAAMSSQATPGQLPQQPESEAAPCVLVCNGEAAACAQRAGEWLQAAPRGAYTTARTVGGGERVLKLSSHVQRLAVSANLMLDADEQVGFHTLSS